MTSLAQKQNLVEWHNQLQKDICAAFEELEKECHLDQSINPGAFEFTSWNRQNDDGIDGGGGTMSVMRGRVFEKVGVNVSQVRGIFSPEFRQKIPGAQETGEFWANGISLVAHPLNPLVPAVHMNTRHICTQKSWFGGGADLTPTFVFDKDTFDFHQAFKTTCDQHNPDYYPKFKKWCDEYFYLPHRNEMRGIGGIFYDYHWTDNFIQDFAFSKDVGKTFLKIYVDLVKRHMNTPWTLEQKEKQLVKRGRYVEFNLLYDRGTQFGLQTGGNVDAILMSMPPQVKWP